MEGADEVSPPIGFRLPTAVSSIQDLKEEEACSERYFTGECEARDAAKPVGQRCGGPGRIPLGYSQLGFNLATSSWIKMTVGVVGTCF